MIGMWSKGAAERYKPGSFDLEIVDSISGPMPDATQAPDGSIIILSLCNLRANSDPGIPSLLSGYNNIGTISPAGYYWDSNTWYTRLRLQWAVASSATRSVSVPLDFSGSPYRIYSVSVIRNNTGESLTATSVSLGSLDLNDTKAPSTVVPIDVNINQEIASASTPLNHATYSFAGATQAYRYNGATLNPFYGASTALSVYAVQLSCFDPVVNNTNLKEDFKDFYATGSNTLSRTANDMDYNYNFIIEAS